MKSKGNGVLWKVLLSLLLIYFLYKMLLVIALIGFVSAIVLGFIKNDWKKAGLAFALAFVSILVYGVFSPSKEAPNHVSKATTTLSSKKIKPKAKKVEKVSELVGKKIISKESTSPSPIKTNDLGLLAFTGKKQIFLKPLDSLGRASLVHIQFQNKDEPVQKRDDRIEYNPVGWHNYKLYYNDGSKQAWLMNRGHLVGYQFSGLQNEKENLVPMTAWLNSGHYTGMDQSNTEGILYYENHLDNWLANHPNFWLDYQVKAIYSGNDLLPRQIELQYVGLDEKGQLLQIALGGDREIVDVNGITKVLLENKSPNATINYADGTAIGTVLSAEGQAIRAQEQEAQKEREEAQNQAAQEAKLAAETVTSNSNQEIAAGDENRVVYVTGGGSSDVYWYGTDNMPSNTNMNNIVSMTESEAKLAGKRHSLRD